MGIYYIDEHKTCSHYVSDKEVSFLLRNFDQEASLAVKRTFSNTILFVLEGSIEVSYNEFSKLSVSANQMVLVPKSSQVHGTAFAKTKVLVFRFTDVTHLCNKYSLRNLTAYTEHLVYNFKPYDIEQPVRKYLELLAFCLADGLNCLYYHELKSDELLILFRAYYSREVLAGLFYPILGVSIDFRSQVIGNYRDVRTVEELASKMGYSVSTFKRKFAEEFDEPAYHWMQNQKAKHLKYKLSFEEIDFATLIDEFGFSSPAHFSRFCKAHFGATPTEYRKQLQEDINKL